MTPTQSLPGMSAVRRGLDVDDGGAQMRVQLSLTTDISLAPAELWPLLSTSAGLAPWYGTVTGDLREGGSFQAPGGVTGRILEVEAPHKLVLTWDRGGAAEPLLISVDPEDDGTSQLRLRHTVTMERAEFERIGPGPVAVGWEITLWSLAAATGSWSGTCPDPIAPPTAQWLCGPEGLDHVRAWSVRWAAQALAAGVDEATARRGEHATADAYGA